MSAYNINRQTVIGAGAEAHLFKVGFGDPAQNDEIVRAAADRLAELDSELGGKLALINGPASLPVAVVISHALIHRYEAVAIFDPKMGSYVVATAHGGGRSVGDLIPADEIVEQATA